MLWLGCWWMTLILWWQWWRWRRPHKKHTLTSEDWTIRSRRSRYITSACHVKKTEPELFFLKSMYMLMMFNSEWTQTAYNQLSGCSLNTGPNHANNQQLKWYRFCLLLVLRLTIHWGWLCSLFLCYTGVSGVASHTSRVLWRDGHQAPQRCHLIRTTWHR